MCNESLIVLCLCLCHDSSVYRLKWPPCITNVDVDSLPFDMPEVLAVGLVFFMGYLMLASCAVEYRCVFLSAHARVCMCVCVCVCLYVCLFVRVLLRGLPDACIFCSL